MAKENPAIKPRPKLTFGQWILALVFAAILLFGLHLAGIVNIPFLSTSDSGDNSSSGFGKIDATHTQPAQTCPATSCDTGECCGAVQSYEGTKLQTGTVHVLVDESCDCPSDTILSDDQPGYSSPVDLHLKNCDCTWNR